MGGGVKEMPCSRWDMGGFNWQCGGEEGPRQS